MFDRPSVCKVRVTQTNVQFVPTDTLRAKLAQHITVDVFCDRLDRKRLADDDAEKMRARLRAWLPETIASDQHLRGIPGVDATKGIELLVWASDKDKEIAGSLADRPVVVAAVPADPD